MSAARQAAERAAVKIRGFYPDFLHGFDERPAMSLAASTIEAEFSLLLAAKDAEIGRLKKWVADLHSSVYINCVYCGHRYDPRHSTPDTMAEVLRRHVEQCPEHPLSIVTAERDRLAKQVERLRTTAEAVVAFFKDAPDTDDYERIGGQRLAELHAALQEQPHA